MSSINEKQELPQPVQAQSPKRNVLRTFLRRFAIVLSLVWFFFALSGPVDESYAPRGGCQKHRASSHHASHGKYKNWHPIPGLATHFEFESSDIKGLSIRGANAFGSVVFSSSKLSNKVIIDLDVKQSNVSSPEDVTAIAEDGFLTVTAPSTNDVKVLSNARIQIPANILIGKFGIKEFELDVINHFVDYSDLQDGIEIGDFSVKTAKGSVKAGAFNTNSTTIDIGSGNFTGHFTLARYDTSIKIASGNVTAISKSISSGDEGSLNIKLADGNIKGSFQVYNSTTLDVAKGDIYVNLDIEHSTTVAEISTKAGSGATRVYVDSIAELRLFKAYHTAVSGDHLITYPESFEGSVIARSLIGDIELSGEGLVIEKKLLGVEGKKGNADNYVNIKTAKGNIDFALE